MKQQKLWSLILGPFLVMALGSSSWAQAPSKKSGVPSHHKTTTKTSKKNLQKSINFNDRVVNGKYQTPGDGLVEVENEKSVFNLISIPSNFNDRREKERRRD